MFKDVSKSLEEAQKELDAIHEEDGLTDEVLDAQLKINKIRHTINKSDPTKKVYDRFVQ